MCFRQSTIGRALSLGLAVMSLGGAGPISLEAVTYPLRWRWSNPAPHGNNIADMAYHSTLSLGVQVCERGQIYTSTDLLLWTPRDNGTTNALRAVTFLGTRIIVTGENGAVLYADAPDFFKPGTLSSGTTTDWLEGVAASTSLAVAVGDNGAVYTSNNGINWRRQTTGFAAWLRGVAYGGGVFVAVGENGFVATSNNGTNWISRSSGTSRHLNRVAYANTRFTAVGDNGVVLNSLNGGQTWTSVVSGANSNLFTVADTGNARVVAGDNEVRLFNGMFWSNELAKATGPPVWAYLSSLGRPDFFLLGGRTGLIAEGYRTNMGQYAWLVSDQSVRQWQFDVTYANNLYVSVGDRATVLTSGNGVEWSLEAVPQAVTNTTWLGVGGTTNLLVAVGDKGSLMVSPYLLTNVTVTNLVGTNLVISNKTVNTFGVVWRAIEPRPTTNDLQGVCALGNLYIVTGNTGTVLTSLTGTNWTLRPTPTNALLSGAAAGPVAAVATGTRGTILYSADGVGWTLRPSGTTNWLSRVRFVGGQFVAVGQNGTLVTSPDGWTWTARASGTTRWLNDVTYVDDTWFVVGAQGTVLTSSNLTQWVDRGTITQKSLYAAATDSRQLITVGVEGLILRSPVIPDLTPVNILRYSRTISTLPPRAQNLFLFGGKADQRFTLEYQSGLAPALWTPGAQLEFYDSSGTLYYLETISGTNYPPLEFYRATLRP